MESKHFNDNYKFNGQYHADKLFQGLYHDLEVLRLKFVSKNESTYKAFAQSWKELRFASVYGVQHNLQQWLEFTEGALHIAKGYIFCDCLDTSVFGIYLIQTLYYKQSLRNLMVKIRLTLSEFNDLQSILNKFKTAAYFEPIFIFRKLYYENAFRFVVKPIEAGIEIGFRKYFDSVHATERLNSAPLEPPVDNSLLKQFEETLQLYEKNKKEIFTSTLFSSSSNFISEINKLLNNFGEIESSDTKEADSATPSTQEDIGDERRNLKKRAFKSAASSSRFNPGPSNPPAVT